LEKDAAISALTAELARVQNELVSQTGIVHRKHPLQAIQHMISDTSKSTVTAIRGRMGRAASLVTQSILEATPEPESSAAIDLCEKIIGVFQNPSENVTYLTSSTFAQDILRVADEACKILEDEPRCYFLQSPGERKHAPLKCRRILMHTASVCAAIQCTSSVTFTAIWKTCTFSLTTYGS
jgi:hypothetical protein